MEGSTPRVRRAFATPGGWLVRYLPILDWSARYDRAALSSDLVAAAVVAIMLIPQSLAYATLAGLPAQMGLYASIGPLIAYAIFGASRTLAVGPVAVISLMTAAAASQVAAPGSARYAQAALALALLSGLTMLLLGAMRAGALVKLLSNPVVNGFTIASSVIIAASQIGPLVGIKTTGQTLWAIFKSFAGHRSGFNPVTAAIGVGATLFLLWVRKGFKPLLVKAGLSDRAAALVARTGPVLAIAVTTLVVVGLNLGGRGVATVGTIPIGLPPLTVPTFDPGLWGRLLLPSLFLSVIGFVSSISVAQTLGAKRRERVEPSQELVGLGVANIAAAFTGGFPVSGGLARSVVNFDAGAETPAAGAFAAIGLAAAALTLTPWLYYLPIATLSATIIVAVLSLLDFPDMARVWRYSKRDFAAMAATIATTLATDVQTGLSTGVILSILLYLHRASKPHMVVVGQVPGSQHFRGVDRRRVITSPEVITLRIDESLTFTNAAWLERTVMDQIGRQPRARGVVLMFSAVNDVDISALESLRALNDGLKTAGVALHLSEVKGAVMDRLSRSSFLAELSGRVFLSQYEAFRALAPDVCDRVALEAGDYTAGAGI
jgi:SulP family sulfate permease